MNLIDGDRRLTEILLKEGSCDSSYYLTGKARFRVNVFSQRGFYSIIMRKLETRIPTIKDLDLPEVFFKAAEEKNGIIFVTGATGSGKSTTLAAFLNEINSTKSIHIVTLEDPVEFVHPQRKATFNQRELGTDFDAFATGLRAALRQAPKVILVGEMRDRETVEIGLSAAETGHLVLSTLHTVDAGQTLSAPLTRSKVFPPMVVQMIDVGEETGALDAMLEKIADFYDDEVDAAVDALTALLEPMLMVFLGVVIGFIVVAMYLPIFEMANALG